MYKVFSILVGLMLIPPISNAEVQANDSNGDVKEFLTPNTRPLVSVFELKQDFNRTYCRMSARKTDLPQTFKTVIEYTGGKEANSEEAVSNYREYFMSLSSRARISSENAKVVRDEIVRIAVAKKMRWADDWKKNESNALFFTTSIASPIAIEVFFQKEDFGKDELEIVIDYLNSLNKQLREVKRIRNEWSGDNKSFDYAVFSYTLGLITGDEKNKKRAVDIFKLAIRELRNDGSIIPDSERVGSALHYSNKAIAALVTLSELALIDGLNLYEYSHQGYGQSDVKKDLNLAIKFLLEAGEDEKLIHSYAIQGERAGNTGFKEYGATNQDKRWLKNSMISWGYYYLRRFPDSQLSQKMLKLSSFLNSGRKGYGEIAGANPRCFITGAPVS